MIQKKICVLGAFGVGKTSLIQRYVSSIFSDSYLTTVGVKIEKKTVQTGDQEVTLILWDIAGEDDVARIRTTYLRGSAGYLLVMDGTRAETLDVATTIQERIQREIGDLPFLVLVNKADLQEQWTISEADIADRSDRGWEILRTSAKDGVGVEEAFLSLVRQMGV